MDAEPDEVKAAAAKCDCAKPGDPGGGTVQRQTSGGSSAPSEARRPLGPSGWPNEMMTTFAAFTMFLGPGLSASFYIVMVGYYDQGFLHRDAARHLRAVPAGRGAPGRPRLPLRQGSSWWRGCVRASGGGRGDLHRRRPGSELLPDSGLRAPDDISAVDPTRLVFSELGGQIGSVVPIVMISVLGFRPSAPPDEFRRLVATPVVVSLSATVVLMAMHLSGFFRKATLKAEPSTLAVHTFSAMRRSVPGWVYKWQFCKGLTTVLMALVMSLAGFYGDPAYTQFLASIKLASDFVGRAASLPLVKSPYFETGPWHRFLAATVLARVLMAAVMVAQLGVDVLPKPLFVAVWCSFSVLDLMMATFADVTCGAFVEVKDRRFVSRLTFLFGFGGIILGLGVSTLVAVPLARRMAEAG